MEWENQCRILKTNSRKRSLSFKEGFPTPLDLASVYRISPMICKDYNNFELRSAIVEKDVLKANRIIKYFEENPKTNPIQMTLSLLFGFFSNLMLAYYAPEKSEQGIAAFLGLKSPWQSREYLRIVYDGHQWAVWLAGKRRPVSQ